MQLKNMEKESKNIKKTVVFVVQGGTNEVISDDIEGQSNTLRKEIKTMFYV